MGSPPVVSDEERRARLARRHRLVPDERTDDIPALVDDVVALHSSDPATVFLSALVRMRNPGIDRVEAALYDERSVVRHHAMRRTMWVMTPLTARRAHAAATRKIATAERKRTLAALAESPAIADPEAWYDAAVVEVSALLAASGELRTREVGEALPHLVLPIVFGAGTKNPATLNAHAKVLQGAAFDAKLVRTRPSGTWISSEYAWTDVDTWLGEPLDDLEPRRAAAELLEHWLSRFGPATDADIRWWFGWTATVTANALADIGAREVQLEAGGPAWLTPDDLEPVTSADPWARLLPGLDATAMGWKERDWYLPEAVIPRLFDRFGNVGPTVWVDGRILGGWIQRNDGEIALDLPEALSSEPRALVDDAAQQLQSTLGDTIVRPRFPSPNQRELLS